MVMSNVGGNFTSSAVVFTATDPTAIMGLTVASHNKGYVELTRSNGVIFAMFELEAREEQSTTHKTVINEGESVSIDTDIPVSLTISLGTL